MEENIFFKLSKLKLSSAAYRILMYLIHRAMIGNTAKATYMEIAKDIGLCRNPLSIGSLLPTNNYCYRSEERRVGTECDFRSCSGG